MAGTKIATLESNQTSGELSQIVMVSIRDFYHGVECLLSNCYKSGGLIHSKCKCRVAICFPEIKITLN